MENTPIKATWCVQAHTLLGSYLALTPTHLSNFETIHDSAP